MTDLSLVNESVVICYCNHLTNFAILVVSLLLLLLFFVVVVFVVFVVGCLLSTYATQSFLSLVLKVTQNDQSNRVFLKMKLNLSASHLVLQVEQING